MSIYYILFVRLIMELLENYIKNYGTYADGGIVIVNSFLNHRMDVRLIDEIGKDFYAHFADSKPTLILTVEASGLGIACMAARYFDVPVLFAQKSASKNMNGHIYSAEVRSFTKGGVNNVSVCADFITSNDRVLIIDDFLAEGQAALGLLSICEQAHATVCGIGICVEKYFQNGGHTLRDKGIDVYSQAVLDLDKDGNLYFKQL